LKYYWHLIHYRNAILACVFHSYKYISAINVHILPESEIVISCDSNNMQYKLESRHWTRGAQNNFAICKTRYTSNFHLKYLLFFLQPNFRSIFYQALLGSRNMWFFFFKFTSSLILTTMFNFSFAEFEYSSQQIY